MKKFVLLSIALALLGALVLPALLAPRTADAWWWWGSNSDSVVACDTGVLEFSAIEGVNPGSQSIGVFNDGGGTLKWKVNDDASWLKLSPRWGRSRGEVDNVRVTVASKYLAPGDYQATITVSDRYSKSDPVTVQVYLEVAEPVVMGPILLGMEGIWPWSPDYVYKGTSASLLVGSEGMSNLEGAAIEIKDCFKLSLDVDVDTSAITGGTLSGSGDIPVGEILDGKLLSLEALLPPEYAAMLGDNQVIWVMINTEGGPEIYMGMLLTDIGGMLEGLPELLDLLDLSESSADGIESMDQGVTIPLGPIMDLLPTLLPVMQDLLPKLLPYIQPILGIVPPVVILMPQDMMYELMGLLM